MKKLKHSKQMVLDAQLFLKKIESNYSKLNKEYAKNVIKLLERISIGENLDLEMLKKKYLDAEEPTTITTIFSNISENISDNQSDETTSEYHTDNNTDNHYDNNTDNITNTEEEIILDKITINNINYYYENKENGRIFDSNSKIVGEYTNGKFAIN